MELRDHIKNRGLSLQKAAELLGISVPTLSSYCTKRIKISAERAQQINRTLDVPLHDLRSDLWPRAELP